MIDLNQIDLIAQTLQGRPDEPSKREMAESSLMSDVTYAQSIGMTDIEILKLVAKELDRG